MRKLITAAIAAATLALAALSGYAAHGQHGTYCPSEDSCGYSYAHHAGTVVRVTP